MKIRHVHIQNKISTTHGLTYHHVPQSACMIHLLLPSMNSTHEEIQWNVQHGTKEEQKRFIRDIIKIPETSIECYSSRAGIRGL